MKQKKQIVRPFDAEIRQMRKNKVILLTLVKAQPFKDECVKRGIEIGIGATYGNGVVLYEK